MNLHRTLLLILALYLLSYSSEPKPETIIQIDTRLGSIKIKLYNDTPIHRDNFIKLIKSGFYDSLLFHRVIRDFMIQGGDPNSKNSKGGQLLGNGDTGYTLPSEIRPNHFHYRGVLAAAREGDAVNPSRRSSGAQFYIVQGKKFTEEDLLKIQNKLNEQNYQKYLKQITIQILDSLSRNKIKLSPDSLNALARQQTPNTFKAISFTSEQKEIYKTIGGVPHLDGAYTIFGEVIEGISIVEKISLLPTDSNNRPLSDLRMYIKIIQ